MNKELLGYAYELIQQNGYNGSMEDFVVELEENKDLQDVSYEILKSKGYDAEESEFIEEFGLGKTKDVVVEDATVTSKPVASEKIKDTDLKLVNGSLERVVVDPDGGVQSAYDQYKEMTKNDPSNYNVESKIGQFLIDKIAGFTSGSLSILGGAADAIEMVGDVATTKGIDFYNYFADDENDFTQEERNRIAGNIEKAFALDDLLYIGADATSKLMTKRDAADGEGITGAIKEGNYLEALDRTLSGMFQAAPSVVAAIVPGGLGLIGASSVGQHYEEKTEDNSENRGLKSMLGSLGQGIIELASERVTRGLFKGVNPLLKGGLGKKMAKSITGRVLGGMVAEGTSEVGSEELNNTIDLLWDIDKFHDENGDFDGKRVLTRVADTFIISSLIGGVTTGGVELSSLGKAVQADRLMSPGVQSEIKKISAEIQANEINNRNLNNKALQNKKIQLEAKRKKINNINKEVVDNLSKDQKLNILALKQETEETKIQLEDKNLTESQIESLKGVIKENNSKINDIYNSKMNELVNQRRDKQTKILDSLDVLGINLRKTELNQKEYDERLKKDQIEQVKKSKLSKKEKEKKINDILKQKENNTAAYVKGKDVIINEEAFESITDLGDSGLSVKSHELLHPILDKLIGNSDEQGKLVEQFKKQLTNEQRVIMDGLLKGRDYTEKEIATEYFTVFSDAILSGDIVYQENFGTTIKNFWESLVRAISPNKLKEVSFKDGKQAYEFIKEYNNSIKKGELSDAIIVATKKDDKAKTKNQEVKKSKTLPAVKANENIYEELRQIDEFEADFKPTKESADRKKELLDIINKEEEQEIIKFSKNEKASEEVQRLFNEKPRDWEFKVIEQMRPITAKLAERRKEVTGFDRQLLIDEIETGERGILDLIRSYDPNKNDSLAAYINTFLSFRAQEGSKRVLKPVFEKDVTEEVGVAAQEDDISIEESVDESIKPTEEQKSKLRRQIRLPDEQVEKVREAVRKTFGTRLPSLQSPKFKKALRKAFDTELFKELKTNVFKARKDYEFFMSQNWKALYDAIPQETLNQSFAPFREAVLDETGKQKREKTPEGERIFRKKNITKEEFLDYFFSPDIGVSTRGTRKDAIVRMAAQELGFDAVMETIQEPEVAKKREFIDPAQTTEEVARVLERGLADKFSITTENTAKAILEEQFGFTEKQANDTWYNLNDKNTANKYVDFIKDVLIPAFSEYPGLLNISQVINRKITGDRDKKGQKVGKVEGILMKALSKIKVPALSVRSKNNEFAKHRWKNSDVNLTADAKAYYNERNVKNFDIFWETIFDIVAKDPKYIVPILHMLEASQNEVSHIQRLGAEYKYYDKNVIEKGDKLYFEHALQNTLAYQFLLYSVAENVNSKNGKENFIKYKEKLKNNYKLIGVSKADNIKLDKAGFKLLMPDGFDINKDGSWIVRYFNEVVANINGGIDPNNLVSFISPETNNLAEDFKINKEGKKDKFSITSEKDSPLYKEINKIIENKTSIAASETISDATARIRGQKNKKFRFFIPPSADDFAGLMYYMLGKGELGNKQMKWMQTNLFDPYAKAEARITTERAKITRTYEAIKKQFDIIPKNLRKNIKDSEFTKEQAVRVYIWNATKQTIPGLSESEQKFLVDYVNSNKDLKNFADKVKSVSFGFGYAKPSEAWVTGSITTDLLESLNTTKREAYLQPWQKNVDIIFSKENLNKLEAAFGREYRIALENSLERMKSGRNKQFGPDTNTAKLMNWVNGSIGAIMFFNTRTAVLQLLSTVNFINWSDNNVFAAGRAFADQKQYWSDFKMLFNSDFLLNRRQGLKMNVNEADLAEEAKKNGPMGVINRILKAGFLPTQMADSFAIAAGGSTFYRNRVNSLMKDGVGKAAAEKQAFQDFREAAEESQQSSRPDKISQQQAGPIGRFILAFANTPSQYARIIKKAALDLKNRRGDDRENVSKIIYYMTVQNLIFNALQQAMFALAFNDDDDDEKTRSKYANVANGMADSVLRGLGLYGAAFSTLKNFLLKIYKEGQKKNPKYRDAAVTLLKISPPISSKISRLEQAGAILDFEKQEIKKAGLDINNPAILAAGQTISALTNLPVDRAVKKVQNINSAINEDLQLYQRIALLGGWNKWDLGIQGEKEKKKKPKTRKVKTRIVKTRIVK